MQETKINIQLQHLLCGNNNSSKLLCCKQNCLKCALVCRHESCNCLPEHHQNCEFVYMENLVKKVASKKRVLTKELEQGFKAVQRVYQSAIDQLSKDRQRLIIWKDNYGLNQEEARFLTAIVENNRTELVGKLVYTVKSGLNIDFEQQKQWFNQKQVQQFWSQDLKKFDKIRKNLTEFYQSSIQFGQVSLNMNFESDHSKNFRFIQQTKSIEKINGGNNWHSMVGSKPIPRNGKYKFSLTIQQTQGRYLMFGIVTEAGRFLSEVSSTAESICYYAYNNTLYNEGSNVSLVANSNVGNIIKFEIDTKAKKISWFSSREFLGSAQLTQKFLEHPIYILVESYSNGDKFTLETWK